MEAKLYTTKQARELLGLGKVKMQYFLNRGMVPNLKRSRSGRVLLTEAQINWLRILILLRGCGFSTAELRRYCDLCRRGKITLPQRKAILETKRQQVMQELEDLHGLLDGLNRKQEYFDQILNNKAEYTGEWI